MDHFGIDLYQKHSTSADQVESAAGAVAVGRGSSCCRRLSPYAGARFLCRRHKLPRGTGHFGFSEVYGKVGVIDLHQVRLKRRPVHALS